MSGIFITGCGTDVGKTLVSAAFLLCAKELGITATVFKPVQTGCHATINAQGESNLVLPDLEYISNFCCETEEEKDELKSHYSYAYFPACSPHLASNMSTQNDISLQKIFSDLNKLEKKYDLVIVEGAGGIMVPLNNNDSIRDFAQMIRYNMIVVADNRLGCINETLLTIEALVSKDLPPQAVILNNTTPSNENNTFIREDNPDIIERHTGVPVALEIPFTSDISRENTDFWNSITQKLQLLIRHVTHNEQA